MSYLKKDIAQLLDAPPSSVSFLTRKLGVEPDDGGAYSLAGAAGLLAAEELRQRGLSFDLAGAAGRALREEIGALIADPGRQSWLLLEDGDGTPSCEIAGDAAQLLDRVKQDHIALKARPLAERALAQIKAAKEARRAVTN